MRCREARIAIVERGWDPLPAARDAALRVHLGSCRACAGAADEESKWLDELTGLRAEFPGDVDVVGGVLRRIGRLQPVAREEVPAAELGWAAAAAVLATLLASLAFFLSMPQPALLDAWVRGTAGHLAGFLVGAAELLWTLAAIPYKLLTVALDAFGALRPALDRMSFIAATITALCYAAMIVTIFTVLWRDWHARTPAPNEKEH